MNNHTVDTCYRLHGLPPHLQRTNSSQVNSVAHEGSEFGNDSSATLDKGTPPSLTHDQYTKLIALIQNSSIAPASASANLNQVCSSQIVGHPSTDRNGIVSVYSSFCNNITFGSWIIDSGASHHICASLHWFHSYSEISPMTIKLPNGHQIITKYAGTINFSTDLTIKNVLYVPNFHINLISVTNLCFDSNCLVSFTNKKCLIQEQKALRMIGSAEMMDGLYYLVLPNKEVCLSHTALSLKPIKKLVSLNVGYLL